MIQRYHIRVTGRVQGVFFRKYTQAEALRLSLAGFVRNDPDGSVYIEAEGDPKNLETFIAWCRKGSPRSAVEKVEATVLPPAGHSGFVIQRD